MITTLAVLFVLGVLGLVFYGFSIVIRRPPTEQELQMGQCSICRERFMKEVLLEREVGDYKVLHFCSRCIESLSDELVKRRNGTTSKRITSNTSARTSRRKGKAR